MEKKNQKKGKGSGKNPKGKPGDANAKPDAENAAEPPPESSSEESDFEEEEGGIRYAGVYVPPPPKAVCSVDSIGPRLIITHIANENFKSYAGRQVLGPFHKSFTSIIGPNGSGKSNVIDSMLFVFGYRATKIRSKKVSVLLHKSENHQNVQSATVEVHFQQIIDKEGDDYEPVPNSSFYISRTANCDNTSNYTISGKRAQFKDVAKLLGSHGIDLKHNRFLILQGEVEQIAMMKPKAPNEYESGMLEYLEDIIGTSRFKKPLARLERHLEKITEERDEKLTRSKLAEKDRDALLEPMKSAIQYLERINKKTESQNKKLQKDIYNSTKELNKYLEIKKGFDEKINAYQEKLKEAEEKIIEKGKSAEDNKKECDSLRSQKEKLVESSNNLERRISRLKEEITQSNKRFKKASDSKKQEEKKLDELEKIPEKNEKEIAELQAVEEKLKICQEKEEAELQTVMANLKVETRDLQDQKDKINSTLIGLNKKKEDAKSKYELAKAELSVYVSNEKKENEKLHKLKKSLTDITIQLEEKKVTLKDLEKSVPEKEQTLARKQEELARVKSEEARTMLELNQQRSIFEEKRQSVSSSASRNRVIDFLMKLKQKGEIPGIFGRLGDLGGIDKKYDCAVSTACGPLDYVVVDTSTTAKECVNALKRGDVGRGNFIALDQQVKLIQYYQHPFKGPENVPRLFDLIQVEDERVKPAFYYALRDTLVANDLKQANRVAYGSTRYRVVTLNGEIIEIAGTMSGGGNEKRMGRMGRSVAVKTNVISQDDLNLLEDNVRKLQEKASSLHMRMNELENEIIILTKEVRGLKTKYSSIKMEIENLIQQESSLKKQVSSQEAVVEKTVSDPEVVKQKTQTIEKLKEEFDKAAAESGVLEEQVAELTSKINNITGGKMQAAQQKLDKVTKQLDKVTSDITKLKVAIKTSDRNCKKSRDRIQAVTNEIAVTEENLKKAQDENKECEEELLKVKDFIETISTKISTITKTIGELKEEKTLLNTEVNALKVALVNESKNSEDVGKQIAEVNEVLDNLKKELSELFLYSIPNYKDPCPTKLPVFTDEEIEEMNYEIVSYNVVVYDEKQNPTETPNLKAIDEYQEKQQIFEARQAELEDAVSRRNEAKSGLDHARKARLNEFIGGFSIITQKLKEMYQMITFGGDAELELVDTLDPFAEGVGFSVRPPKKSWKFISNLSGGEKTLSSLALVFALHYYKPSPLYVMDEIDAALDFKNVSIVGNYIKERTRNAQFIIISLRSNMFELADVLVGIYKTHNCTKSVTVTPKLFAAKDRNSNVNKAAVTNGHRHNSEENDGAVNTQVEIVREVSVPDSDITRSPPRKRQK